MNPSLSRLTVALPLSFVLSTSIVLLTWSLNAPFGQNLLFNYGIIFSLILFSFMCFITVKKIVETESHDYNQAKLDLMLESVLLTGDAKLVTHQINSPNLDDFEFNYDQTKPIHIPAPERDKSLEF